MSATTIHFVRHGKVYNPDHLLYERLPDFHLSDLGRRMAQATAAYLANSPQTNTISAVYSSPLDRTRETADAILRAAGGDITEGTAVYIDGTLRRSSTRS